MAATRVYTVTNKATGEQMLVRSVSRASARSTALRDAYAVELASQEDLIALVGKGVQVIEAQSEADEAS